MYYSTTCPSPVGMITLASDGDNLVGLWLEEQKYFGDALRGEEVVNRDVPVFVAVRAWLDAYFAGGKPDVYGLPLRPSGSEFRKRVWSILCEIPYGEIITYGDIARKMSEKAGRSSMSSRAVGGAVGHNPISIIIPCHRVVGAGGSLTGYAGGIGTKAKLLALEGADREKARFVL